eukprot:997983-Pelagomonas_calceolata.AAC.1
MQRHLAFALIILVLNDCADIRHLHANTSTPLHIWWDLQQLNLCHPVYSFSQKALARIAWLGPRQVLVPLIELSPRGASLWQPSLQPRQSSGVSAAAAAAARFCSGKNYPPAPHQLQFGL